MKNSKFKTYSEFLLEGGNARVIDRESGEVLARAEKINLQEFKRSKIVSRIVDTLEAINNLFEKEYEIKIWKNFKVIRTGEAFSGSSEFFIDPNIEDAEFVRYKPSVGDVDVIIPKKISKEFEKFMPTLEGKQITPYVTYLGQDRVDFGTTWLAVFKYSEGKKELNFQIDFEYGDWDDIEDTPSEWAKFSHNSSWEDITEGMKGVHHKYLIIDLVRALSKLDDVKIATKGSTPENIRLISGKESEKTHRLLAFSVDKGLRVKFRQMEDSEGNPIKIDGKFVFQEIPTSESVYVKELEEIYEMIFNEKPTKDDMKKFKSFTGLTSLIKEKIDEDTVKDMFQFMLEEHLFGKRAQILEKNNPILDNKIKWAMVNKLFSVFPYLKKKEKEVDEMSYEYYRNFKMEAS